jgi:glycine C-acetyltransferase
MEGDVADLNALGECCDRHDAVLVIDDSHGTGVLGPTGRGTIEHFHPDAFTAGGAIAESAGVHVLTSTLGKALGGGNGGFVAGSRDLIDYLVQMSRPHLFSNALAPATACGAQAALDVLREEPERVGTLHDNVSKMRSGLSALGYELIDAPSAIIPIMVGDTAKAISLSQQLLELGVFVVGFGFPVVPEGQARLRVQLSAAHSDRDIDRALEAFSKVARHVS